MRQPRFPDLKPMTILLVAVNAKYIHTCPAIYSLKAYADSRNRADGRTAIRIETAEFTVNDRYQDVLSGIMAYHADIIAFSVYIWNVDRVHRLLRDIRRICGEETALWAGGPEATWYPEAFLTGDEADLCMIGEGEVVFSELAVWAAAGKDPEAPDKIRGIAALARPGGALSDGDFHENRIIRTGMADPVDMNRIPFLYRDLSLFDNRIIYYEASRGCPFSCAYCLSGRERGVRLRSLETVREELQFFLDQKVRKVKFVDRTFNANPDFAMAVWEYIRDHDNGITNFHFEIEADVLTDGELELASSLRPGLIQMEIGVQSANPDTLRSIHRNPDLEKVRKAMEVLTRNQNINLHLDLIAGLPFEDLKSFRRSFQAVYEMRPHQLQLGFLKLLKGTELYEKREAYSLACSQDAPYEVLKTGWLSFEELQLLHRVSDRVEEYVNSQGFRRSLPLAEKLFEDAFSMFEALADHYSRHGYDVNRPSAQKRYKIFEDFILERILELAEAPAGEQAGVSAKDPAVLYLREMIRFDRALHTHPARRMTGEETFNFGDGPVRYRFDHNHCSPVNKEAAFMPAEGAG